MVELFDCFVVLPDALRDDGVTKGLEDFVFVALSLDRFAGDELAPRLDVDLDTGQLHIHQRGQHPHLKLDDGIKRWPVASTICWFR